MKIIFTCILILLTSAVIVNAQGGWVTHVGDNRISVKFPTEPKEVTPGSFMAMDNDSAAYIFTIVDFVKVAGIDSVALAPMKTTPEFAAQLKVGMKQSLPEVDLADFTIGVWRGFSSYSSAGTDPQKKKYDIFMFIIGNKLYSTSTVRANGVGATGRDYFLKSIILTN